jgi:predicted PurR-regulated permease PerM
MVKVMEFVEPFKIPTIIGELFRDLLVLPITIFINKILEYGLQRLAELFYKFYELIVRSAKSWLRAGEGLNDEGIISEGEKGIEKAESLKNLSESITSYNDVFFGMDAMLVTLIVYLVSRIVFVIYFYCRKYTYLVSS